MLSCLPVQLAIKDTALNRKGKNHVQNTPSKTQRWVTTQEFPDMGQTGGELRQPLTRLCGVSKPDIIDVVFICDVGHARYNNADMSASIGRWE